MNNMEYAAIIETCKSLPSKLNAVKFIRDNTGLTLSDSKEFYEKHIQGKRDYDSAIEGLAEAKKYFLSKNKTWQLELINLLLNNL